MTEKDIQKVNNELLKSFNVIEGNFFNILKEYSSDPTFHYYRNLMYKIYANSYKEYGDEVKEHFSSFVNLRFNFGKFFITYKTYMFNFSNEHIMISQSIKDHPEIKIKLSYENNKLKFESLDSNKNNGLNGDIDFTRLHQDLIMFNIALTNTICMYDLFNKMKFDELSIDDFKKAAITLQNDKEAFHAFIPILSVVNLEKALTLFKTVYGSNSHDTEMNEMKSFLNDLAEEGKEFNSIDDIGKAEVLIDSVSKLDVLIFADRLSEKLSVDKKIKTHKNKI